MTTNKILSLGFGIALAAAAALPAAASTAHTTATTPATAKQHHTYFYVSRNAHGKGCEIVNHRHVEDDGGQILLLDPQGRLRRVEGQQDLPRLTALLPPRKTPHRSRCGVFFGAGAAASARHAAAIAVGHEALRA